MTDAQKEQVRYLRCEGLGYGAIATRLGISENTVKSFCRRNNLTGVASKEPVVVCRNCAGRFLNTPRENRENFAPRLAAAHGGSCTRSLSIKPPSIRLPAPIAGRNFRAMGTGNGSIVPTPAT